jgi:serine palmitoyltransferase
MEYADYQPDSRRSVLKSSRTYALVGHKMATYQQYVVYVIEGVMKNCYNQIKGIKDWRTDDENGEKNDLLPLSKGKAMDFFYIANLYGNIEDTFNRPIYSPPEDFIDVAIREPNNRRGYFARLVNTQASRRCLNLGSYNYLGFGGVNSFCTPAVKLACMENPITSGSCASELGRTKILKEVEDFTARYVGKEAALVVGMGFATNSTVLPAIVSKGDLIISDKLNHNSIVEGARLSGAKIIPFNHNCAGDLERVLQDATNGAYNYGKIVVVVEGIYSMEGELCNLKEIVEVCKLYKAHVYLDEAHSIGAVGRTGRGVTEELGVDPKDISIMMGTYTKSFGAAGGYVAGDAKVINAIRRFAIGYTDAVSMPAAVCAQVLTSLRVIAGEDGTDIGRKKLEKLRENSLFFRNGLEAMGLEVLGHHPSPIMPVMLYQPYKIGDFSRLAFNKGLAVVVVGAPATPVTLPRVRFCISAAHETKDLQNALDSISEIADTLSLKFKLHPPSKLFGDGGSLQALERMHAIESEKAKKLALSRREECVEKVNKISFVNLASGSVISVELIRELGEINNEGDVRPGSVFKKTISTRDMLNLANDETMRLACAETVGRYGLGSCSPRGFYGTFRPHVDLEHKIAEFLNVGEAVLYSFGACTASSAIQSLTHRNDVAVVDRGVGPGILAGLKLAKVEVRWYDHADAEDCARVFAKIETEDGNTSARLAKPVRRRWLITEAVFERTGKIAPLRELVALKNFHHARMILDESFSFGTMGDTGRGLTEHFRMPATAVDVIVASLENACASVGGFVAGDTGVVAYQRLMGSGYVFSASLPPYLATASLHAIERIIAEPERVEKLQMIARSLRSALIAGDCPGLTTDADSGSPVVPIRLVSEGAAGDEFKIIRDIAEYAREKASIGVVAARFNPVFSAPLMLQTSATKATLRCFASASFDEKDIEFIIEKLGEAAFKILPAHALKSPTKRDANPNRFRQSPRGSFRDGNYRVSFDSSASARQNSQLEAVRRKIELDEEVAETKEWKNFFISGDYEDEPASLSVPLLVVLLHAHNLFRRYIIGQINVTSRLVPDLLRSIGMHPTENKSALVRIFYIVSSYLGSRSFYEFSLPVLVWVCAEESKNARFLMLWYSLTCAFGCLCKGMLATQKSSIRSNREVSQLGALRNSGTVHAWPSVGGMNASFIPFFLLRWKHGSVWLWEMENPYSVIGDYAIAFVLLLLIVVSRLANGDSPANVQGGVVLGAILLRTSLISSEWTIQGLSSKSVLNTQGFSLFALVFVLIALVPVPMNSRGKILPAASMCYRRMWRTLFYALFFYAGCVWRRAPAELMNERDRASSSITDGPFKFAFVVAFKAIVGHIVLKASIATISNVAQLFWEYVLKVYIHSVKPRFQKPGEKSASVGTVHMRSAALHFVELTVDITSALVCSHGIPRIFDKLSFL